jgi:hypothetical protein
VSNTRYEYGTLEWIWDQESIRCTLPEGGGFNDGGSYQEVVDILTRLGQEGWEVVTCATAGNWLFWTLKRPL